MSNIKEIAALFLVGSLLLVYTSCGNNTADANSSVAESSEAVMDEKDKAANESAGTETAEWCNNAHSRYRRLYDAPLHKQNRNKRRS